MAQIHKINESVAAYSSMLNEERTVEYDKQTIKVKFTVSAPLEIRIDRRENTGSLGSIPSSYSSIELDTFENKKFEAAIEKAMVDAIAKATSKLPIMRGTVKSKPYVGGNSCWIPNNIYFEVTPSVSADG